MNYIRTKEGISEIEYSIETDIGLLVRGKGQRFFNKPDEYKQANSIEELCDEFVFVVKQDASKHLITISNNKVNSKDNYVVNYELSDLLKLGEIYGSIWVGPDLHSIAKMNYRGELELL